MDIDPFMDGFYDTDNPIMAAFDRRTGKLVQTFGRLDDVARKTLTGYYFTDALSVVGGGELAYTDSYSGKVYVTDTTDIAREKACYEAFSIDEKLLPPADTAKFYSYAAPKAYRGVFCRKVSDMRITPDRLYCVIAYGDMSDTEDRRTDYTYLVIDRKTGARREYLYPKTVEGYTVFTRGLREEGGKVMPFMVLKGDGGEALLRVYSVE